MKGQSILVCDTTGLTDLFDRVIIATGTSNRQTRALAKNVHDKVKKGGGEVFGSEGEDTGEWVLVDCGDAVVHILQPAIREYYRLEDIWGEKQLPLASVVSAFRRVKAPVKRKPTARNPIAEKPTKQAAGTKTGDAAAPKKPAKTAASNKAGAPAAKKQAAKKPAAKKPAANKPAANKPAAKKPAAGKSVAKTPAVKKPMASAAPAKKAGAKKALAKKKP
jgi:ribosome-associated protein